MKAFILFLLYSVSSYSQCNNIEKQEDKFTKVITRSTVKGLELENKSGKVVIDMHTDGQHTIKFDITSEVPIVKSEEWEQLIFLFEDGTTEVIKDEFGPLGLNEAVADDAYILDLLKKKKVVAIRLFGGNSNSDFDVSEAYQDYFIKNIACIFPIKSE